MYSRKYKVYVAEPKGSWCSIVSGWIFSNFGMFCINLLIAILGANILIWLELPEEETKRKAKLASYAEVEDAISYAKKIFWIYANHEKYNFNEKQYKEQIRADLLNMRDYVVDQHSSFNFDATEDWTYAWTGAKALLFTVTIMTTIGYGHITPKTNAGKMFCIIFAIIGIPILLVFMTNIGDFMGSSFKWIYSRICCAWCRKRRAKSEESYHLSARNHKQRRSNYMPDDEVTIPIMVSLLIILVYLLVGAIMFSAWEDWELGSSLYFCFISLTTIGFGDLVPLKSFLDYNASFLAMLKMVATLAYIVVGIALLSMCIQLMQNEILGKVTWLAAKMGVGSNVEQALLQNADLETTTEESNPNIKKMEPKQ